MIVLKMETSTNLPVYQEAIRLINEKRNVCTKPVRIFLHCPDADHYHTQPDIFLPKLIKKYPELIGAIPPLILIPKQMEQYFWVIGAKYLSMVDQFPIDTSSYDCFIVPFRTVIMPKEKKLKV